ncbi:hypothetical protein [Clostridium polynesiense]|uniref:hypothetical protein n=1 Tax=Clostridium polynesiense TaxID=1325933 RepID=UPI00058B1C0C|nr:hypothetical protein [Clostridium polynesiense]
MKRDSLNNPIRIVIALSLLYFPRVSFSLIAAILIISAASDKNQIPIAGTYCELPKDKYEIVIDEKKFRLFVKSRGYLMAILFFIEGVLLIYAFEIAAEIYVLLLIIVNIFFMGISNLILEKYYKLRNH